MNALTYQPGNYRGRITKWNLGKAGTGNPQFAITFLIIGQYEEGDGGPELVQCSENERTLYRTITANTIDFVVRDLRALGYDKDSFAFLDSAVVGAFDFRDKEVEVTCKHDTYKGATKERWDFTGGGGAAPLDDAEVRKLDALFGRKLRGDKPARTPAVLPPTADPQPVGTVNSQEEQIPF